MEITLNDIDLLEIGNEIQIAGMIFSGKNNTLLVPLPDEEFVGPIEVLEMDIEDWKTFLKQTDILETQVLMKDGEGFKKAILRKSTRQIDQKISWNVYKRDGYKCRYCGRDDVPLTVDHLVLWEEGGPSIEENLVSACKKCNKTRGNMQYSDWVISEEYRKVSVGLNNEEQMENVLLIGTLDDIPRKHHIPSRGKKKKRR